jgi:hypothetical protein
MQNTGVIEGVVRWDADEFTTEKGVIGRVKIEHAHEYGDKKSTFTVKGFGPFGQQVADLVAGQKVKVKYEIVEEKWQKDDEWQREVTLKVTDLKAEAAPESAFDEPATVGADDDIPF